MRALVIAASCSAALLSLVPAAMAQPFKLDAPPPVSPRPTPVLPPAEGGVQQVPTPDGPVFVPGLSRRTRTGRMGVAAWSAPGRAVGQRGPGDPDQVGWVGAGFAVEWGGSPRHARPN
jgi:hypothetical protein